MSAPAANVYDDELDLRELLLRLWRGRTWIVGSAVVCIGIAAIIAFTTVPVYRAKTVLTPAGDRDNLSRSLSSALGSLGGLASLAGVEVGGADAAVEEALAVLTSREFTEKFIVENNLMPELYPGKWNAATKAWKDPADVPPLARGYKTFDEEVRYVERDKKTGLVVLQIDWRDREKASEWANALVRKLNSEMRVRAISQSDASIGFLKNELANTTVLEIREAINRLLEGQIRQRMLANVTQEYSFRVVDRALVPDLTDKVRPKKMLMMLVGGILGGLLGAAIVMLRAFLAAPARPPTAVA
jgi:uncharacterized protein involved in exopolysaccharide biosynthesis